MPRIRAELGYDHGVRCSRKRVFRLMRMLGIQSKRKRRKFKTTWRSAEAKPAPDLVERNFVASPPDEVWVADIKYIRTREGYLYLADVTDIFTRTVAGWAMSESLETKLVEDALEMAILRRRPKGSVIHHSDQGTWAVHQPGLRPPAARSRHSAFHGQSRRCLRQCPRRELLVDAGPRASRRHRIHQSSRGTAGHLQLHRELVQRLATPLLDRDALPWPSSREGGELLTRQKLLRNEYDSSRAVVCVICGRSVK